MKTELSEGQIWYRDTYLTSDHWRRFRAEMIDEAGGACQRCRCPSGLQVHHLTYERLYYELPSDVLVLCGPCHQRHHTPTLSEWEKASTDGEILKYVPEYQEGISYTRRQLELLADRILLDNPSRERPVLSGDALRARKKKEVYTALGVPDPSIEQGLYWRTSPVGRAFRFRHERLDGGNGHGFYLNRSAESMPRHYEYVPEPFIPTKHVGGDLSLNADSQTRAVKVPADDLPKIVDRLRDGETLTQIAEEYGVLAKSIAKRLGRIYGKQPKELARSYA